MSRCVCGAILGLLLAVTGSIASAEEASGKWVTLFDGKSLEGWNYHLVDPNVKMEDVWRVENGVLICKGEPLGYLATKESFQDFEVVVQWRWPGKPGNSGVFLRICSEPIGFMPKCFEAQLKHGNAGDLWAFRGTHMTGPADRLRKVENSKLLGSFVGSPKLKDAEKEPGQWNEYRITAVGDRITVKINGEVVNEATGCDLVAGPIGLQSEGGEVQFRNVKVARIGK
jgi:hypothetical protein